MGRDVCYFDGQCGLCRRSTTALRRLDWLHRLEFRDMTLVDAEDLPVPMERAIEGMPMRTADGRILVGYPAVRRALRATPLGVLPALLMYLPGISHAGRVVYGIVASNRARDVCQTPQL